MSNRSLFGTVVRKEKVDSPFAGIKVIYNMSSSGKEAYTLLGTKTLQGNTELSSVIKGLTEGVKIKVDQEQKGQFFNTTGISVVTEFPEAPKSSFGGKPFTKASSGYDTAGAIKGNIVSNAVQLAIGRTGGNADLDDLRKAADDVLELHRYAEKLDVAGVKDSKVEVTKEVKKTAKAVKLEADDDFLSELDDLV